MFPMCQSEGHRQILTRELEAVGLRLNKRPPQVWLCSNTLGCVMKHVLYTAYGTKLDLYVFVIILSLIWSFMFLGRYILKRKRRGAFHLTALCLWLMWMRSFVIRSCMSTRFTMQRYTSNCKVISWNYFLGTCNCGTIWSSSCNFQPV